MWSLLGRRLHGLFLEFLRQGPAVRMLSECVSFKPPKSGREPQAASCRSERRSWEKGFAFLVLCVFLALLQNLWDDFFEDFLSKSKW